MKKVYYSVKYRAFGMFSSSTVWFDNKEDAVEFSKKDYHDAPVVHRVSNPETIDKYDELVALTKPNKI